MNELAFVAVIFVIAVSVIAVFCLLRQRLGGWRADEPKDMNKNFPK